jgi:hypothetical protein
LAHTQLATVPSKTGHARGVEQPGAKVNDMSQIHPQARTTPRVRAEIQASEDSPAELARRYNISEPTAAKWQGSVAQIHEQTP